MKEISEYQNLTKRKKQWIVILYLLIVPFFLLDILIGSVSIPIGKIFSSLVGVSENKMIDFIVWQSRIPQSLTALGAGALLGISGLILQTHFRNPLAGPSVLGVTSGSTLGVGIMVLSAGSFGWEISGWSGQWGLVLFSFLGALLVLLLMMAVLRFSRDAVSVLLVGLMAGYFIGSLITIMQQQTDKAALQQFVFWGFGSFSAQDLKGATLFFIVAVVMSMVSLFLSRDLNRSLLGELYARSMGMNTGRHRRYVILITGFMVAWVTSFCGPVAFLGVATPHLIRRLLPTEDHRLLLPAVAAGGALLSLLCSLLSRLPVWDQALPINAITSMVGAPIVVWVIFRKMRRTAW